MGHERLKGLAAAASEFIFLLGTSGTVPVFASENTSILEDSPTPQTTEVKEKEPSKYDVLRDIVDSSLNPDLMGPFLDKFHYDLATNPQERVSMSFELGYKDITKDAVVYKYAPDGAPVLELSVIDTKGDNKIPTLFTLTIQLRKDTQIAVAGTSDSTPIFEKPNLFSPKDLMQALEIFNAPQELKNEEFIPRSLILPGPEGIARAYQDKDGTPYLQAATFIGEVSYTTVYPKPQVVKPDVNSDSP